MFLPLAYDVFDSHTRYRRNGTARLSLQLETHPEDAIGITPRGHFEMPYFSSVGHVPPKAKALVIMPMLTTRTVSDTPSGNLRRSNRAAASAMGR